MTYHVDERDDARTPPFGYPDDPPCEDCGAPGGVRCRLDCPTGLGEPYDPPAPRRDRRAAEHF